MTYTCDWLVLSHKVLNQDAINDKPQLQGEAEIEVFPGNFTFLLFSMFSITGKLLTPS